MVLLFGDSAISASPLPFPLAPTCPRLPFPFFGPPQYHLRCEWRCWDGQWGWVDGWMDRQEWDPQRDPGYADTKLLAVVLELSAKWFIFVIKFWLGIWMRTVTCWLPLFDDRMKPLGKVATPPRSASLNPPGAWRTHKLKHMEYFNRPIGKWKMANGKFFQETFYIMTSL